MPKTKLTAAAKQDIIKRAEADLIQPRRDALAKANIAAVDKMMKALLPQHIYAMLHSEDVKYLDTSSYFQFHAPGIGWASIHLHGGAVCAESPDSSRWLLNGKLGAEMEKHYRWQNAENEAIKAATNALVRLVTDARYLEDLQNDWPEGREYYKDVRIENKVHLPAVQVAEVNKLLGLPKH